MMAPEPDAPVSSTSPLSPKLVSARRVDQRFLDELVELDAQWDPRRRRDLGDPVGGGLTGRDALRLFESQVLSRHLDFEARVMGAAGEGFYTIGSSGHEGNASVAAALRPTDPALLHYRSGAFFLERARQVPGQTPTLDVLLGLAASRDDPISGGRHKVWGSLALNVPPQTSTIASHLPKAVGLALGIERAAHLGVPSPHPRDAIVLCSFGDASLNHATAQAAFQAAAWATERKLPVPVLFLCEDNGIGISVSSPPGWTRTSLASRGRQIAYFEASGLDLVDAHQAARAAVDHVRLHRHPAVLRLDVVRLLGHAGADPEHVYREEEEIFATEKQDPLLCSARFLATAGVASPSELRDLYESTRDRVRACSREAVRRPRLESAADVEAPLAPRDAATIAAEVKRSAESAPTEGRDASPRPMPRVINRALRELLTQHREMLVFGEDVGKRGGVYGVTDRLQKTVGRAQVFDSLLDETSILGMAIGCGMAGLIPVPEIQFLAYLHNAIDQLRGEASSLQFFSQGQHANPMVVRIASLGYQKGFGGHFHNDNSTAAVRDIPGLVVGCPSRGDDAAGILRTLVAAAKACGTVSVQLEPIALYKEENLEPGDGAWKFSYPEPGWHVPIGEGRLYESDHEFLGGGPAAEKADLTIVTYGNGVRLSLLAARALREKHGKRCTVLDLRWLQPLPTQAIVDAATAASAVLVVDEGRRAGGVAEPVMSCLLENQPVDAPWRCARVTGTDTFIPLGPAANHCLPSTDSIREAAESLLGLNDGGEA
ncbi:MAG: thiamine pyrophosphate-dependent enzyme [Acidobacteriota bacterium]